MLLIQRKLLNSKEKFKISIIKMDNNDNTRQIQIIEVFYLDLNEVFGTDKINVEK